MNTLEEIREAEQVFASGRRSGFADSTAVVRTVTLSDVLQGSKLLLEGDVVARRGEGHTSRTKVRDDVESGEASTPNWSPPRDHLGGGGEREHVRSPAVQDRIRAADGNRDDEQTGAIRSSSTPSSRRHSAARSQSHAGRIDAGRRACSTKIPLFNADDEAEQGIPHALKSEGRYRGCRRPILATPSIQQLDAGLLQTRSTGRPAACPHEARVRRKTRRAIIGASQAARCRASAGRTGCLGLRTLGVALRKAAVDRHAPVRAFNQDDALIDDAVSQQLRVLPLASWPRVTSMRDLSGP